MGVFSSCCVLLLNWRLSIGSGSILHSFCSLSPLSMEPSRVTVRFSSRYLIFPPNRTEWTKKIWEKKSNMSYMESTPRLPSSRSIPSAEPFPPSLPPPFDLICISYAVHSRAGRETVSGPVRATSSGFTIYLYL